MESLSGRPLTIGLTSDQASAESKDQSTAYPSSIFDLIYAFGLTRNLFRTDVPSSFLEAASVDSARLLGKGASFTASLRALPEGPKTISSTRVSSDFTITTTSPAPPRPKHVVFKVAKVKFDKTGSPLPEYRSALQSVLTEFHALIYPPLFQHRNIIDILGLAWGTNPFESDQRLPALCVEYAEHGTLRDVLRRDVASSEKRLLCYDIACGLQALHDAGLVHGDVKAENVLICSSRDGQSWVAKIADFGFSVVEESESSLVWLGGTRPWQAPEVQRAIPRAEARQTDIYSFGLLVWSIAINGLDPFKRFLSSDRAESDWDSELQEYKEQDGVRRASETQVWFPMHFYKLLQEHPGAVAIARIAEQIRKFPPNLQETLLKQACTTFVSNDDFLKHLDAIFVNSLSKDVSSRDLHAIIDTIRPTTDMRYDGQEVQAPVRHAVTNTSNETKTFQSTRFKIPQGIPQPQQGHNDKGGEAEPASDGDVNPAKGPEASPHRLMTSAGNAPSLVRHPVSLDKPSWSRRGFKHLWFSWQAVRELTPSLQRVIHKAYSELEDVPEQRGARLFLLCALKVNGYGCVADDGHALAVLRRAAHLGNWTAQGYLYRVHASCGVMEVPNTDIKSYLERWALRGSRAAWGGYASTRSPEQIANLHRLYTDAYAGVGATWYGTGEMLHGLHQQDWIKDDFLLSQAAKLENIHDYRVNRRGDTLLHFVASCGRWKPLKALIEQYGFDVNCRNHAGDTPLTCAMRAGHGGNVKYLLMMYKADPNLASDNGETPLHWLVNAHIPTIKLIIKDLVSKGAVVDAMTKDRVVHSEFPGTVDADFQMIGTPLSWAVHDNNTHAVEALLEYGANPYVDDDLDAMGPLNWAAYYHRHECLKMMIDALEQRLQQEDNDRKDARYAVLYSPLLRLAVHAADRWSMILRNGINWRTNLRATLDILREKTRLVEPQSNFGRRNQTLFYFAVSEAHDEVVEYMLEHKWHSGDINQACGEMLRTPVLEAVRWCRLPLVKKLVEHGAHIHALACNPYQTETKDWSALHILAHEGQGENTDEAVELLLGYGLDIEGRTLEAHRGAQHSLASEPLADAPDGLAYSLGKSLNISEAYTETPLSCALRVNAFDLCTTLVGHGASLTSLSLSAGLYAVAAPTTILGHVIISNARYSLPRLRYLLAPSEPKATSSDGHHLPALFIVEPERNLSALHRAAMANNGISTTFGTPISRDDFDLETNAEIMAELLAHFRDAKFLNATCRPHGKTALMYAVEAMNSGAVRSLLKAGADRSIEDTSGRNALEYAVEKIEAMPGQASNWEEILMLFEED